MRQRALAIAIALVVGIGGAAVAAAPAASAHDPSITISCDSVRYQFENYVGDDNTFTLYVDDLTFPALEVTFGERLISPPAFELDPTSPHEIRYTINATDQAGRFDYSSPVTVTTPCRYPTRDVRTTCVRAVAIWGGPLDSDFRLDVTVRTETGDRQVSAAVVPGISGGYGPDSLGVRYTDWTGAESQQPLTELAVKAGEFVFPYRNYAGNPIPYSVSVSLSGKLFAAFQDTQCGFQSITISGQPGFTPASCTTGGTLLLPANDGIDWIVQPLDGALDNRGPGRYLVLAVAQFGYSIAGPTKFSITVPRAGGLACADPPTLATVTASASSKQGDCPVGRGSYTLSDTHGVQWLVDGEPVKAGTYAAAPGSTVIVKATIPDPINTGWNDPDQQTTWTFSFVDAVRSCDLTTLALPPGSPPAAPGSPVAVTGSSLAFTGLSTAMVSWLLGGGLALALAGAAIAIGRRVRAVRGR